MVAAATKCVNRPRFHLPTKNVNSVFGGQSRTLLRDNEGIVEVAADILALNNGVTWTLRAQTERGYVYLLSQVGADNGKIELTAQLAQEFCMQAMEHGLIVSSRL